MTKIIQLFKVSFILFCVAAVKNMAAATQNLTVNGVTYVFPSVGDQNWGQNVTNWATAVTGGMLQKAGGTFTLTADAYFGSNYGLRSRYFKSNAVIISSTGVFRLASSDIVSWRNYANTGNVSLSINSNNNLLFDGNVVSTRAANVDFIDTGLKAQGKSGNLAIGKGDPEAVLDVARGTTTMGSALIRGSSYYTTFNYSDREDTYIRGGKPGSNVWINDTSTGFTKIDYPVVGNLIVLTSSVNVNGIQYYYPNSQGAPSSFLKNDGVGNLTWQALSIQKSTTNYAVKLEITTNSANTQQLVVTADAVEVMSNLFVNVSTRVDISKLGNGGVDVAPKSSSTWYSIWLISKDADVISVVVSSASNSQPTMPATYNSWRRIGYVYVDSSGNVRPFYKQGNKVKLWTHITFLNNVDPTSTPDYVDLSNYLSPGITTARINIRTTINNANYFRFWALGSMDDMASFEDRQIGANISGVSVMSASEKDFDFFGIRKAGYDDPGNCVSSVYAILLSYTEEN